MKYICLKSCVINKLPRSAGTIVDVSDSEASLLLGIGRISPYDESACDNRSVGLDTSNEFLAKRRGRPRKE